jgi:hypothetical protein
MATWGLVLQHVVKNYHEAEVIIFT